MLLYTDYSLFYFPITRLTLSVSWLCEDDYVCHFAWIRISILYLWHIYDDTFNRIFLYISLFKHFSKSFLNLPNPPKTFDTLEISNNIIIK